MADREAISAAIETLQALTEDCTAFLFRDEEVEVDPRGTLLTIYVCDEDSNPIEPPIRLVDEER